MLQREVSIVNNVTMQRAPKFDVSRWVISHEVKPKPIWVRIELHTKLVLLSKATDIPIQSLTHMLIELGFSHLTKDYLQAVKDEWAEYWGVHDPTKWNVRSSPKNKENPTNK